MLQRWRLFEGWLMYHFCFLLVSMDEEMRRPCSLLVKCLETIVMIGWWCFDFYHLVSIQYCDVGTCDQVAQVKSDAIRRIVAGFISIDPCICSCAILMTCITQILVRNHLSKFNSLSYKSTPNSKLEVPSPRRNQCVLLGCLTLAHGPASTVEEFTLIDPLFCTKISKWFWFESTKCETLVPKAKMSQQPRID